jgi:hypothetical protein
MLQALSNSHPLPGVDVTCIGTSYNRSQERARYYLVEPFKLCIRILLLSELRPSVFREPQLLQSSLYTKICVASIYFYLWNLWFKVHP